MDNSIYGVDINRNWVLRNNDILLVDGEENLRQAIFNRLTCAFDDLGYFYDKYGSKLYTYFGNHLHPSVLQEIANEVIKSLRDEPRLFKTECNVARVGQNTVAIHVKGIVDANMPFNYNFVFDVETNNLEKIGYRTTQMRLHIGLWDCKHQESVTKLRKGEPIYIYCRVLNQYGNPVPIGWVDFWIGNQYRHVEVEDGYANLTFTFPENWRNGEYTIEANYHGLGTFMDNSTYLGITLDDKWETSTEFRHENNYGLPYTEVMFPTRVEDIRGFDVVNGDVVYYLQYDYKLGTILDAENIYSLIPTKGRAVWSRATVYDEWGNFAKCGCINFYLNDALNFMKATQTTLQNGYMFYGSDYTFLKSKTVDSSYEPVYTGKTDFYYRECPQILETTTEVTDNPAMVVRNKDKLNQINTKVTDEDGIYVFNGDVDYSVRNCGRCDPYDTKLTTNNAYVQKKKTFTHSTLVDEDNLPLKKADIAYSFDDLPLSVTTVDKDLFNVGARYGAMIVDFNDNIVNSGIVETQQTDDGTVTNYVSSDDVDEDEAIKLKLVGDKK